MNTYQITGTRRTGDNGECQMAVEWIDAETLEEARSRFFSAHPAPWWAITGEELTQAQELAEEQSIRAGRAEDEVIYLKAKLYDYMAAPQ